MTTLMLVALTLLPLTTGLRCIGCTSDPSAPNWACFGGTDVDNPGNGTIGVNDINDMSFECNDDDGEAQYCLTMVTWEAPFPDGIQNKVEGVNSIIILTGMMFRNGTECAAKMLRPVARNTTQMITGRFGEIGE